MSIAMVILALTSPKFQHQGEIPELYTCEGDNISPPLSWRDLPDGTKSLVLIVEDPDAPDPKAPKMTWVHWVLYNLPVDSMGLSEAVSVEDLPEGTLQGVNSWKKTGYGGPCPPVGRHRYFHKLYALELRLPDLNQPSVKKLEKAMEGHVLAKTELIGTYQKRKKH